jgi:hypothetical protein
MVNNNHIKRIRAVAEKTFPLNGACCGKRQRILIEQSNLVINYTRILKTMTEQEQEAQLLTWENESIKRQDKEGTA